MRTTTLRDGTRVPVLGQGTWKMTNGTWDRDGTVAALNRGLDLGMTLVDTAEVYGDGAVETLVGEAVGHRREEMFLVSKVAPENASRTGTAEACERSLRRLRTDRLDLYLLHWRGPHPLAETVEALESLASRGLIGRWGVSNFDADDMAELLSVPGGDRCAANQVLYNAEHTAIEEDLLPMLDAHGVLCMAYSPLGEGAGFLSDPVLATVAARRNATPAQVASAFVLMRGNVVSIPKAARAAHVENNALAADLRLTEEDEAEIRAAFRDRAKSFFYRD